MCEISRNYNLLSRLGIQIDDQSGFINVHQFSNSGQTQTFFVEFALKIEEKKKLFRKGKYLILLTTRYDLSRLKTKANLKKKLPVILHQRCLLFCYQYREIRSIPN